MQLGKSVKLFLVDGSFGGLVTTEIMNWSGHVISAPRSSLGELLQRDEITRTGLYILLGENPDILGGQVAYIGEADNIGNRLRAHAREEAKGGKDFWDRIIAMTSKDANLTKAHARYLESRIIALAAQAGRVKLVNNTAPDPIALPEADTSDMEYYIAQAQIILPVLNVNLLRTKSVDINEKDKAGDSNNGLPSSPVFRMKIPGGGVAYAQEIDGEFTVLKGSEARKDWASTERLKSGSHARRDYRDSLIENGVLVGSEGGCLLFSDNHVFTSPSAAASTVAATESRNGRAEWKDNKTGISFGDWQARNIENE